MSQTTIAIIGLVGNLLLLLVTGSYVLLTRSMAVASQESAKASVDAARYAAQSVQAALAALDVEFEVTPQMKVTTNVQRPGVSPRMRELTGVRVESTASNVFVHGARIEYYGYEVRDTTNGWKRKEGLVVSQDLPVVLQSGHETGRIAEIEAPVLLHKAESADFLVEGVLPIPAGSTLTSVSLVVFYALDAQSVPRARLVDWRTADRPLVM